MESYIEVVTNKFLGIENWEVRYAILKDHIISLCKEKGGKIVGKIHLLISKVNP